MFLLNIFGNQSNVSNMKLSISSLSEWCSHVDFSQSSKNAMQNLTEKSCVQMPLNLDFFLAELSQAEVGISKIKPDYSSDAERVTNCLTDNPSF